jgi:hypothetical protein
VDQTLINALRFVPQAYIHRHNSGRNVIEETSLQVTMGDDDHYQLFALLTNKDEVGLVPAQSPRATVLEKSVIILLPLHKPRTIALSDKLQAVVERVN